MDVKYCPKCGKKIENGMRYCSGCGNEIMPHKAEKENTPHKQEKGKMMMVLGIIAATVGGFVMIAVQSVMDGSEYRRAEISSMVTGPYSQGSRYVSEVSQNLTLGKAIIFVGCILLVVGIVRYILSK